MKNIQFKSDQEPRGGFYISADFLPEFVATAARDGFRAAIPRGPLGYREDIAQFTFEQKVGRRWIEKTLISYCDRRGETAGFCTAHGEGYERLVSQSYWAEEADMVSAIASGSKRYRLRRVNVVRRPRREPRMTTEPNVRVLVANPVEQ